MTEPGVRTRREDAVGWLEFNRPPHNVFTPQMIEDVLAALAELEADPAVRVIVIGSALPAHFSAGADLALFADLDTATLGRWIARVHQVVRALRRSTKPLLAAVGGAAVGGGLEMTFHCDVRFAAEDARLGLPEVRIGFIPPLGSSLALPHLLGRQGALRFLYEGAMIPASQAHTLGLVDTLVPPAELHARVQAYGTDLAGKPPEALAAIRRCIAAGPDAAFEAALQLEYDTALALVQTENFREGVRAFLEKRKPVWR